MSDPVVDTQFTTGTVITADWLNGVNDFVNDPNATKIPYTNPGTGGVSRTQSNKNLERISVKDFGATGNGTTDDRAAIQAAFNYVNSLGGGTLYFPAGTYRITGYIGTTFWDAASMADNMNLHFDDATVFLDPNYSIPSGTWFWHAISIEGNNVSVTGNLRLRSNQTLNWAGDLPAQRTNYLQGVILGGKGYGHLPLAIGQEREGVLMEGIDIKNFHLPLIAEQASRVKILNCKVSDDTDTGILIENCLSDIEVAHNTLVNSGDDHFFARHYATTPWATAGFYIGNIRFHHNYCENTFAKFGGFGGYSDVICSDNYGRNCWFAGFNVEGDTTWVNNNKRLKFHGNILREAGRAWDPSHPVATYRLPVTDTTVTCGILITGVNRAEFIEITDNNISNPQSHAISVINAFEVRVTGNTGTAGIVTKAAVNYPTTGSSMYIADTNRIGISGNVFGPDQGGTAWPNVYEVNGDVLTERVRIISNPNEEFTTALFVEPTATVRGRISYEGWAIAALVPWVPGTIPVDGATPTFTCNGARVGDMVQVSYSQILAGLTFTSYVNANDVVALRIENRTGGGVALASGNLKFKCTRPGQI